MTGFDAIVLAGGRSSRLGGSPKALLVRAGRTLLKTTLDAVSGAATTVVVGALGPAEVARLSSSTTCCREYPPYGGPVAGIASGLSALPDDLGRDRERILVLGCDMPAVSAAVRPLLDAPAGLADRDALLAQPEGGGPQYLVGLYRRSALERAFAEQRPAGRSVRSLLAQLRWSTVAVPAGSCDDVDTWADAARLGWVERTSPTA